MGANIPSPSCAAIASQFAGDLKEHEVLVFQLALFDGLLFEGKKQRWSKRAINAQRIVMEIFPTILVRGLTVLKLGSAYIASQLDISEIEARDAKQLLREQGIITLIEQSRKGQSVAVWAIHSNLVTVEERKFTRLSQLRYHWAEALGEERGERLWKTCFENTDPRRTPRKFIAFSRSMGEQEWEVLLEGHNKPTLCG